MCFRHWIIMQIEIKIFPLYHDLFFANYNNICATYFVGNKFIDMKKTKRLDSVPGWNTVLPKRTKKRGNVTSAFRNRL